MNHQVYNSRTSTCVLVRVDDKHSLNGTISLNSIHLPLACSYLALGNYLVIYFQNQDLLIASMYIIAMEK
jgi:hypothetical protein